MHYVIFRKVRILIFFLFVFLFCWSACSQIGPEDKIKNSLAFQKYREGQNAHNQGRKGWKRARVLLNEADSIEPNNPLILSERGSFRMDSKTDIDEGLNDLKRAFELAKSNRLKESLANNLGLTYLGLYDIESACEAWKYAGQMGNYYIRKYCTYKKEPIIQPNLDEKLILTLQLKDTIAYVTSRYNTPQMSDCDAVMSLENEDIKQIKIPGGSFNYGLVRDDVQLFMEAIDESGNKLVFFTETEYMYYSPNEDKVIEKGERYSQEVNITFVHHFWKEGNYKIRLGLKSAKEDLGFKGVYFSNWVNLKVEYQP